MKLKYLIGLFLKSNNESRYKIFRLVVKMIKTYRLSKYWLFNVKSSEKELVENQNKQKIELIDKHLKTAKESTERIIATINGDTDWFLKVGRG